jgi:NADPH-dependent FMN reductase
VSLLLQIRQGQANFLHRITETLSEGVLAKLHASPKSSYPTIDATSLEEYDAFLFGIPTRFGNFPAQWKTFWDTTGKQWPTGGFHGKYAGLFIGTATQGGGQESTAIAAMSTLVHYGMVYVPLGYKTTLSIQSGLGEARGGSPWGAGTYTVSPHAICLVSTDIVDFRVLMGLVCLPSLRLNLPLYKGRTLDNLSRKYLLDHKRVVEGLCSIKYEHAHLFPYFALLANFPPLSEMRLQFSNENVSPDFATSVALKSFNPRL